MTREQAEARALELYPTSLDSDRIFQINKQRKAYLKGWEDMEEVNTYTAEYVKASKLRKEYSEATNIQDRGIYHYSEWLEAKIGANQQSVDIPKILTDFFIHWYNAKGNNTSEGAKDWWKENKAKHTLNQDKLREAALLDWLECELVNQPKEMECDYHADKNWTDDYSEALGNKYSRVCRSCNSKFFGHKGRYACRECGEKPQQQSVEGYTSELIESLDDDSISTLKSMIRVGIKMSDANNWKDGEYHGDAGKYVDVALYQIDRWVAKNTLNQDKVREAAEKVVEVYESDAYTDDIIELLNPLEELSKALK